MLSQKEYSQFKIIFIELREFNTSKSETLYVNRTEFDPSLENDFYREVGKVIANEKAKAKGEVGNDDFQETGDIYSESFNYHDLKRGDDVFSEHLNYLLNDVPLPEPQFNAIDDD